MGSITPSLHKGLWCRLPRTAPRRKSGIVQSISIYNKSTMSNILSLDAQALSLGDSGLSALPLLFSWWRRSRCRGSLCGPRRQVLAPLGPTRTFLYPSLIIWTLVQANREWWEQKLRELYALICTLSLPFNLLCVFTHRVGMADRYSHKPGKTKACLIERCGRVCSFSLRVCETP